MQIRSEIADGVLEIIDSPSGERMRFTLARGVLDLIAVVVIRREAGDETLELTSDGDGVVYTSAVAPAEPHEFDAVLRLSAHGRTTETPFHMAEPTDHHH